MLIVEPSKRVSARTVEVYLSVNPSNDTMLCSSTRVTLDRALKGRRSVNLPISVLFPLETGIGVVVVVVLCRRLPSVLLMLISAESTVSRNV